MKTKITKFICVSGIVFALINLLDLVLSLKYFEFETNFLVISNPSFFYVFKLLGSWLIISICVYKLLEGEQDRG